MDTAHTQKSVISAAPTAWIRLNMSGMIERETRSWHPRTVQEAYNQELMSFTCGSRNTMRQGDPDTQASHYVPLLVH